MSIPGSYNASTFGLDLAQELERLRLNVELGWPKEARTLGWFGLRDGMDVLEVGSGPGFMTRRLLDLLPTSTITSLDIDPLLIEHARIMLQDQVSQRLRFVQASVMETGLPDDSFDFCVARLLFRHLPDPLGAARAIWRVLKPGGKLVIIEGGSTIIDPPQAPETRFLATKRSELRRSHGEDYAVGYRVGRILSTANYIHIDLEAVVRESDTAGLDAMLRTALRDTAEPLIRAGVVSEAEAAAGLAAQNRWRASPDALIVRIALLTCGEKPRTEQQP